MSVWKETVIRNSREYFVDWWLKKPESKNRCFYCGKYFSQANAHGPYFKTKEHLVSQMELEGQKASFNTVWACAGCNNAKNGGTVKEFRDWLGTPFFSEKILKID